MRDKKSLKSLNTFGVDVSATDIIYIYHDDDIIKFLSSPEKESSFYVLGDGSNVLFTKDYDGVILKMETKGIEIVSQTEEKIFVKAKAGEDWDEFVRYCLVHNYCGLENLALIPGKVGSSPIQNIGAYGQEVRNFITKVYAISVSNRSLCTFENKDCQFGYRTSIFKQACKGQYIITDVEFMLTIDGTPDITYDEIKNRLSMIDSVKAQDVYNAVSYIRSIKLPDWRVSGNAGSFFKNPIIPVSHFTELKKKYPNLKAYSIGVDECKMSAAQLIEFSGWKGKKFRDAGVHPAQPLVLVNYGNATGKDILDLATYIQNDVYNLFQVQLEIEVNII
ncbi:MAG: UDP-N-acetylmuramate dehydrogenase [Bacteroidales bacterium]|jgi:UDP-N-acetylmuramate dehydrogenase|nr:UDP-N-acetylmuramate dehydrogenase [Bacteroidales bacterium]